MEPKYRKKGLGYQLIYRTSVELRKKGINWRYGASLISNKPIFKTLFKNTILIGKTTITAEVYDDTGVERVEFYINGDLVGEDTESPFEFSLKKVKVYKRFFRRHTLSCIAYDDEAKTGTCSIDILAFLL